MASIEEKIRVELGESVGVAHVMSILEKDDRELLVYLESWCDDFKRVLLETRGHLERGQRSTVELGLRIVEGNVRRTLFYVRELQARGNSIEVEI